MAQKIVKTSTGPHGTIAVTTEAKVRVWMQVAVSAVILVVGIFVLTSPNFVFPHQFDQGIREWAAGWVGAVIGYWLS